MNPQWQYRKSVMLLLAGLTVAVWGVTPVPAAVPPTPGSVSIRTKPDMPKGYAVGGRDSCLGVQIGSYACFFYGDTMCTQPNYAGDYWVVNTMYHTTDLYAGNGIGGGYNWWLNGYPPDQFIPYTAAEAAYKAAHKDTDGYFHGIWPIGEFKDPNTGVQYITFEKVIERPGQTWIDVGTGFAIAPTDPINGNMTRIQHRPGNTEDYLMWDASEGSWAHMPVVAGNYVYMGFVDGSNWGYLYIARAPLTDGPDAGSTPDFLEKANWRYYSSGSWSTSPSAKTPILSGIGVGTINWNAYLPNGNGGYGCWLMTYMGWVDNKIYYRATNDGINWSAPRLVYTVPNVPQGYFPYFARAHKFLEAENGRTQYITFCMPCTQIPNQDVKLIRARFQ